MDKKLKIVIWSLVGVVFVGFITAANAGLSKTEVFKCQKMEKDVRHYGSMDVESWRMENCEAHGFKLSI